VFVDKPGAPQTQVRVATMGAARSTPDYEALRVMNEMLGGLFSSRINLNLREEHGYTYGASSQFVFRRTPGPFLVGSGVRTDVTGPAVGEIFKEVRKMRDTLMTADELAMAKDSLVRSLPSDFQTSGDVTASTANIYIFDLGLDYFSKYPARLAAVTSDQAKAAAEKYLDPDKMIVVAVGDRAKIERQLRSLNLGAVEVRNADAALVGKPSSQN
jgi:zinc protease